jgi:serine/threonine-protein kinase SRPK3
LEIFQHLSSTPDGPYDHCASLLTHFVHPGIDDDEEHLCLVTKVFGASVDDVLNAQQDGFIPVPTVKQILRHLLLGIASLHKRGIVHTGMFAL